MTHKYKVPLLAGVALLGGIGAGAVGLASAKMPPTDMHPGAFAQGKALGHHKGGVMGTVSAVSGTTITVTSPDGGVFTVDASKATVQEKGAASSLANIQVGDLVMVRGTITTASMTAVGIMEGLPTPPKNEKSKGE